MLKIRPLSDAYQFLSPRVVRRVETHLGRVRAGVRVDYRTDIWGGAERSEVRKRVSSFTLPTGYKEFDELEESAAKKFGSFSVRLPFDEVSDRLISYYQPKTFKVRTEILHKATEHLRSLVPLKSLRATDAQTAFENSPRGTNWGLPYFTSDKSRYPQYLDLARDLARQNYPIGNYWPCVLGVRSQPNGIGEPAKWRPLHMASHVLTLVELQIQRPLLTYLRNHPWMVAWKTPKDIAVRVTALLAQRGMKLSSDFSSYDASIPSELIMAVFDCIKSWFVERDRKLIEYMEDAFLHVGILTPEGYYTGRQGGVPSGLTMTNMIDTLVQILIDFIVAILTNTELVDAVYLGDDGVKLFADPLPPDEYAKVCSLMNLTVNPDKSLYSEEVIDFLQRRHSRRYVVDGINAGYRSQLRTANGVISFEVYRDISGYALSLRGIQQVEECSENLAFREMVEWLYLGDDFLQSMTATEILRKGGGLDKVESELRTRSYPYNHRDLSELSEFETVRVLDELRTKGFNKTLKLSG